ncbi:MAG: F0F1 ATP synthase subunit epsilon, partial [Candidatus Electrothrix sp. ATG2]|nr:F0F1 ATP synthase subunit epsilon [Candidatus Electrothrix sp. ATG2]
YGHDIDVDRALQAKERAERRLAMEMAHDEGVNRARAEASLQRSVARLAAAQRTTI